MINILSKKILDKRFLNLITSILKAGYFEDWTYHRTYSGTPQGGVISPILANIYLHELDVYLREIKVQFDKGKRRSTDPKYAAIRNHIRLLQNRVRTLKASDPENPAIRDLMKDIRMRDRERKKLPVGNPKDSNYRRLLFCRYADDVLLGVIGSLQESREILQAVGHYLQNTLNLELAEEKSHVVQASKGTTFLGYQVTTCREEGVLKKVKRRDSTFYTFKRIFPDCIWLTVPQEKVVEFCSKRGYSDWGTFRPQHRSGLLQRSDTEIVLIYNAEIRGFLNYYQLAHGVKSGSVRKLWYMWRNSLFSTLASKHKTQKAKIARKLQQGHKYVHMYEIKGKPRRLEIYNIKEFQRNRGRPIPHQGDLIAGANWARFSRTEITQRLNADTCEYCGKVRGYFEVHHVKKLKDITGKELWKRTMISMKRKTLVLCVECHEQLHKGTLPSWKRRKA